MYVKNEIHPLPFGRPFILNSVEIVSAVSKVETAGTAIYKHNLPIVC